MVEPLGPAFRPGGWRGPGGGLSRGGRLGANWALLVQGRGWGGEAAGCPGWGHFSPGERCAQLGF